MLQMRHPFAATRAVRRPAASRLPTLWMGAGLFLASWVSFGLTLPLTPAVAAPQLTSEGGWIELDVHPRQRRVQGRMILFGAHSDSDTVFATLPPGAIGPVRVALQCMEVVAFQRDGRLTIPLGQCPAQGCALELRWTMDAAAWSPRSNTSRLDTAGYRLAAADVLPRLTAAPDGHPKHKPDQDQATAAPADWHWVIRVANNNTSTTRRGRIPAMDQFQDSWTAVSFVSTHSDIPLPTAPNRHGDVAGYPGRSGARAHPYSPPQPGSLRMIKASPCNEC